MTSTLRQTDHDRFEQPKLAPLAAAETVDVSVVIITWNSAAWIESCLAALPAACGELRYEVVVFDNHSSDATADVVRAAAGPRLRLVQGDANHGFSGGVNRALSATTGDYIFLLNPDCELAPGSVQRLHEFLKSNGDGGAAVPLLLGEDGEPQREFQLRRLPTLRTLAIELLLIDKVLPKNDITNGYRYRDIDITSPQPIEQPAAAAMLVRRSVFDRLGGFDERFQPAWFEDVDYCRRMSGAGDRLWLVPQAVGTHHGGASLEHVSFKRFTDVWYTNLFRYGQKWLSPGKVEVLRWLVITGMLLRIAALAFGFSRPPVSRGEAYAAFRHVLAQAFHRWDDRSPSS
jgi:GT2 family glycosyltransferase